MIDIFEQLKKAENTRMTSAENAHMRQQLISHMISGSLVAKRAQVSTWTTWGMFSRATAFILAGFIVGGTSLSFASLGTVPGDTLYPIKTTIAESIGRQFAFGTEAKARYNASLVSTRVTELATLKQSGKLQDVAIAQTADDSFNTTFSEYQKSLEALAHEGRVARVQEIAQGTLALLTPTVPETKQVPTPSIQVMNPVKATPTLMMATQEASSPITKEVKEIQPTRMMMGKMSAPTMTTNEKEAIDIRLQNTTPSLEQPIPTAFQNETKIATPEDHITSSVSKSILQLQNIVTDGNTQPKSDETIQPLQDQNHRTDF